MTEVAPQPETAASGRKPWTAPRISEIPVDETGSSSPLPPS